MTTTILLILLSLFLLLLTLRIGYTWGRTMSESLVKEYTHKSFYRDGLDMVDPRDTDHQKNVEEVNDFKMPEKWGEYWEITGPRSN